MSEEEQAAVLTTAKTVTQEQNPAVTRHSISLDRGTLNYSVESGCVPLCEQEAQLFFVAYTREETANHSERPLIFSVDDGFGPSTVWLHLGALGPKRVRLPGDGTPPQPPFRLEDNPCTWLEDADLIFVDLVMTPDQTAPNGASRTGPRNAFAALGGFIRDYLTRSARWSSPLFLAQESCGAATAAQLAATLVDHGIAFNGILLVSSLQHPQTALCRRENELPHILCLPTFAATAWFHKRLSPDLQANLHALLAEVKSWAVGEYAAALAKGDTLSREERQTVIARMARYTGLPEACIDRNNLRISVSLFCKVLLWNERRLVGRLDTRLLGIDTVSDAETLVFDFAASVLLPAYTAAFNAYVQTQLQSEAPCCVVRGFETLAQRADNHFTEFTEALRVAIARSPHLKLFVASGCYDLITPSFAAEYILRNLGLDPAVRANITLIEYEAGHTTFMDPGERARLKSDVVKFLQASTQSAHPGQTTYSISNQAIASVHKNGAIKENFVTDRTDAARGNIQEQCDLVQEITRVGTWEYDVVADKMTWSPEVFQILEFDPDQGAPSLQRVLARVHAHDVATFKAMLNTARNGQSVRFDARVRYSENRQGWVHVAASAQRNQEGELVMLFGAVADANDRKRTEQEQELLTDMLDRTSDLVAMSTPDGRLLYCNQTLRDFLGVTPADVPALTWSDLVTPGAWEAMVSEIIPAALRVDRWSGESIFVSGDGKAVPVSLKLLLHRDADRNPLYLSAIGRDVSQTEATLRQAGARLREAQQRERSKHDPKGEAPEFMHETDLALDVSDRQTPDADALLVEITHDFENLLSLVACYVELMSESLPEINHRHMRNAAARAARLTEQLRANKPTISPTVFRPNTVLEKCVAKLQPSFHRSIELIEDYDPNVGNVWMDSGQLEQVAVNLISNALDAMPDGGKLTIKTTGGLREKSLSGESSLLPVMPEGMYAILSVSDTGVGMTPEVQQHLFEPFFTTKEKGKGLGLANVYGIVKQNKGFVWAFSEPGQGTTFRVWLPSSVEDVVSTQTARSLRIM